MSDKTGHVSVHRLVAAEKLGRPLRGEEHVHHLNGDPEDNRPENLVIVSSSEHTKLHWASGDWDHLRDRVEKAPDDAWQTIRDLRKAARIKQGDLAAAAGMRQSHLCEIEHNQPCRPLALADYRRLILAFDDVRIKREIAFQDALAEVINPKCDQEAVS